MNLDEIRKVSEELEALIRKSEAVSSKSYEEKKNIEKEMDKDKKGMEPSLCDQEHRTDNKQHEEEKNPGTGMHGNEGSAPKLMDENTDGFKTHGKGNADSFKVYEEEKVTGVNPREEETNTGSAPYGGGSRSGYRLYEEDEAGYGLCEEEEAGYEPCGEEEAGYEPCGEENMSGFNFFKEKAAQFRLLGEETFGHEPYEEAAESELKLYNEEIAAESRLNEEKAFDSILYKEERVTGPKLYEDENVSGLKIAGEEQPAIKCWTDENQPSVENGFAANQPSVENGTEANQPSAENGTGANQPSVENGTEANQPSVENGTEANQPTAENGTQEKPPFSGNGTEASQTTAENGTQEKPPFSGNGTEANQPTAENGTEEKPPSAENGTEANQPFAENGTEEKPPFSENGTEANQPSVESGTDENQSSAGSGPDEAQMAVKSGTDEEQPAAAADTDEKQSAAVSDPNEEQPNGTPEREPRHNLSGTKEESGPLADLMEVMDSDYEGLKDYIISDALESGKEKSIKKLSNKRRRPSRSYIRPSDGLLAAFLVPVIVMIIIFIQRGIFPFGDESFLRTDMYHQYAPFFSEFQHKLQTGGSLLYSWDIGMGVNFSALYAYYLASPLNWLLIICPKNFIIEFMTYNIVLKIGLCGLTFAYYLRKNCKTSDFGVAFFGIFYALSGYMAAYSWNIMWLDCILLFPLVMLGLERLVKEKKCFLYCITLGLSILSNYYISIMICIFMVLYFIVLLILEKKKPFTDYLQNIVHFAIYSLVAGGLAAVVLLPEIFALQATASGNFNFPKEVTSYFSIFDMFARHLGNVAVETGLDHWPNIYCGVAVLIFFLLYLTCKKISVREKVVYCGMLLFFYASFSVNILNFIWHGFHYPNSLPCRQSFIYIFLMLYMSYRAYMHLKDISWKNIAMAFLGSICFVILAEKLVDQKHFEFYVFYVAIIMLSVYAGLLYLYKQKKMNLNILLILALGVVSVEAAVNTTITSVTITSRSSYISDNKDVAKLMKLIQPADTFYRVEKVTSKTKNDGAWMNFPSVSLFSSTAKAGLTEFFKEIGCEGNTNAYSITGSTPLVDSLFSVKYGLYSEPQAENDYLSLVGQSGDTYLYERNDTLPLGFMVDDQFEAEWKLDWNNPALVQNDLCNIIGAQPVLWEADGKMNGSTYRFLPDISGDYYAYVTNRSIDEVTVTKGEDSQTFKNVDRGFLLELGYCEAGTEVVLTASKEDQNLSMSAYRFDNQGLKFVYNILNQNPLTVTNWSDNQVEGKVKADHEGILFTTIPYDKGWSVQVDGTKQEPREMFGAFLGIDMPAGDHTVKLVYTPQGLHTGAMITGVSVLFLLAIWSFHVCRKRKALKKVRK